MSTEVHREQVTVAEVARAAFAAPAAMDADALHPLMHPDLVEDYLPVGRFEGRETVLDFLRELWAAAPDGALEVLDVAVAGHTAFVAWHWEGTFTGTRFQGIQPAGARVALDGVDRMEIEDGLLRRNTVYYDGVTFARAIGMLPPKDGRTDRLVLRLFNAKTKLRTRRR